MIVYKCIHHKALPFILAHYSHSIPLFPCSLSLPSQILSCCDSPLERESSKNTSTFTKEKERSIRTMNFSSIPAYLDPANWQQPSNHQDGNGSGNHPQQQPPQQQQPVPSLPLAQPHAGSIRPGSMAERARLANIPLPEAALKCPRCGSSNTKFCYFNNYNLTQPRHFCKTCRRYWTRGGALRHVPVGGGCRRNKRTKAASSKSPVSNDRQSTSSSTSTLSSNSTGPANIVGLTPQIPPLRFLSPLGQLTDHYGAAGDLSWNYGGNNSAPLLGTSEMNFQIGPSTLLGCGIVGGVASLLSGGGTEQWRSQQAQQFPFLGGLEPSPAGLYSQFQASTVDPSGFVGETSHQMRPKLSTSMLMTQQAPVKMEENQELNLSKQLMRIPGNDHQWNSTAAAAWTTDTSFSSSSTRNPFSYRM